MSERQGPSHEDTEGCEFVSRTSSDENHLSYGRLSHMYNPRSMDLPSFMRPTKASLVKEAKTKKPSNSRVKPKWISCAKPKQAGRPKSVFLDPKNEQSDSSIQLSSLGPSDGSDIPSFMRPTKAQMGKVKRCSSASESGGDGAARRTRSQRPSFSGERRYF